MDASVIYADLTLARIGEPEHTSSPPSLPTDTCRCPRWHRLALKLGCVGLILLILGVIGLSVLVVLSPLQTTSIEKSIVEIQESNRTKTTDSPAELKCANNWLSYRDKCVQFSQESNTWKEAQADCARKGATLLLMQDREELRFIEDSGKEKASSFWIGLNYTDKKWKWINSSTLNSAVLHITGEAKKNSCASISKDRLVSEDCASDNKWICQRDRVSETIVQTAD